MSVSACVLRIQLVQRMNIGTRGIVYASQRAEQDVLNLLMVVQQELTGTRHTAHV